MNDTSVQLGAKFIRPGFGLFIFGLVMSFGVVGHYMVGSRWDTGTEFLKNITLWYACAWTLLTAVVLIGAVGMIAIGAAYATLGRASQGAPVGGGERLARDLRVGLDRDISHRLRRLLRRRHLLLARVLISADQGGEERLARSDVSGPAPKEGNGSGDDAAELAKKLQNPVANLISVPIQNNWDFGIGQEDAMRYLVNVQPVIPFSLNQDWNSPEPSCPSPTWSRPSPTGTTRVGSATSCRAFSSRRKIRSVVGLWAWGRCSSTRLPPTMRSAPRNGARARPPSY